MDLLTNRCMIAQFPNFSVPRLAPSHLTTATNRHTIIELATLGDWCNGKNHKSLIEIANPKSKRPLSSRKTAF